MSRTLTFAKLHNNHSYPYSYPCLMLRTQFNAADLPDHLPCKKGRKLFRIHSLLRRSKKKSVVVNTNSTIESIIDSRTGVL